MREVTIQSQLPFRSDIRLRSLFSLLVQRNSIRNGSHLWGISGDRAGDHVHSEQDASNDA